MTAGLFRPESIEHQRRRLWGEVIIVQPVRHAVLTLALVLFSTVGLTYLVIGSYAKTETVQGYIAPAGGLAQVYAAHGGTVSAVLVHEGDFVTKGQPLVELSLDTNFVNGSSGEKLRAQNLLRIGEIDKEIAAANARFNEEEKRLAVRTIGIKTELLALEQRLAAETQTLVLL